MYCSSMLCVMRSFITMLRELIDFYIHICCYSHVLCCVALLQPSLSSGGSGGMAGLWGFLAGIFQLLVQMLLMVKNGIMSLFSGQQSSAPPTGRCSHAPFLISVSLSLSVCLSLSLSFFLSDTHTLCISRFKMSN